MEVTTASQTLIGSVLFTFGLIFISGFLGEIFRDIIERWRGGMR